MKGFWLFMFSMNILIPLIMLIFGGLFSKKAPKKINPWFGYRTNRSMKNIDTWRYAHYYIGKIWFNLGFLVLVLSSIIMAILYNQDKGVIGFYSLLIISVQVILMIIPIYYTEKELAKTFDQEGKRK